jgi:hypothetical protein
MYNCLMKTGRRLRYLKRVLNSMDEVDYKNSIIDSRFKYTRTLVYNPNWVEFSQLFIYVMKIEPAMLLTTRKIAWNDFGTLLADKRKLEIILDFGIEYIRIYSQNGYQVVTHYIPDLLRTRGFIGTTPMENAENNDIE